jgi:hypothetical protein
MMKEVAALRKLKQQQQGQAFLSSQASSSAVSSPAASPAAAQSSSAAAAAELLKELGALKLLKAQHHDRSPSPLGGGFGLGHHRTSSEGMPTSQHISLLTYDHVVQRSASLAPSEAASSTAEERAQLLLNGGSFSSVASFTQHRPVGYTGAQHRDADNDQGDGVASLACLSSSFQPATRISRSGQEKLWSARDI